MSVERDGQLNISRFETSFVYNYLKLQLGN